MKIPVHNNTQMTMYVHGLMIPVDETRHIDEEMVPPHLRPAPEAEPEVVIASDAAVIEKILGHNAKEVIAMLPSMSVEHLNQIEAAEQAAGNRKGVLEAIAREVLQRAANAGEGDTEMDAYAELVQTMDDDELQAQLEVVKESPSMTAIVEAEIEARNPS